MAPTEPTTTPSKETSKETGNSPQSRKALRRARAAAASEAIRNAERRRTLVTWSVGTLVAVIAVGALYGVFRSSEDNTARASYDVGSPGIGERAPDFTLPDTTGTEVSLSHYRGRTVLLYFHEGGGCQPCWDQIRDLEQQSAELTNAGVDELVTITTDPADLVAQKMRDDGLSSVGLSDTDLAVSKRYETNKYGMMGETRNGHSFILVDPDGRIQWRADYGGAPNYTMYVPVDDLLADLEEGRQA